MKNMQKGSCLFPMSIHRLKSSRKASKCKKLIEQVQYRLKFLQARKSTIIAQTREDIVKLLQDGYYQRAYDLAEELYKDKCRANAYEVINEICECISNNLTCIIKNRDDIPMDLKVALSNLSFAASRCGELPELIKLRSIFRELLGNEFEDCNVDLKPETLVKSELRALCAGSISDDVKLELIKEISKVALPEDCNQVYDIHEEKYEMEQDRDGTRLEKKTDLVYTPKNTSEEGNEMKIMEDVWPRKITESANQMQEEINVYQEGIKEKPSPQSYYDSEAAELSLNSKGVRRRTNCGLCSDIQAYQPLPQSPSTKKSNKQTQLQKSMQSNICTCCEVETKEDVQRSSKRSIGHIHPKLPRYEDLAVTLKHPGARVCE